MTSAANARNTHKGRPGTSSLLMNLRDVGRHDLALAGGKGANLGELVCSRFPVPPGFVVSTVAYDRFLAANHLEQVLNQPGGEGAAIRTAFEHARIPTDVAREIVTGYEGLGSGPVAVRS